MRQFFNLIQLVIIEIENRRARFSEYEQRFIDLALPGVEKAHAKRLVRLAQIRHFDAGEVLVGEGDKVETLLFVLEGAARIDKQQTMVGVCGRDDFIGEIGFMLDSEATATATVTNQMTCFSFDRAPLAAMLGRDENLRHAMESSFNRNLVGKLIKSNNEAGGLPRVSIPEPAGKPSSSTTAEPSAG